MTATNSSRHWHRPTEPNGTHKCSQRATDGCETCEIACDKQRNGIGLSLDNRVTEEWKLLVATKYRCNPPQLPVYLHWAETRQFNIGVSVVGVPYDISKERKRWIARPNGLCDSRQRRPWWHCRWYRRWTPTTTSVNRFTGMPCAWQF